jgi:hypothetical protein
MFVDDHSPPHFHVRYGDDRAIVSIADLRIIRGRLPPTAQRLVEQWARAHQTELMENWRLCEALVQPKKILPLQ